MGRFQFRLRKCINTIDNGGLYSEKLINTHNVQNTSMYMITKKIALRESKFYFFNLQNYSQIVRRLDKKKTLAIAPKLYLKEILNKSTFVRFLGMDPFIGLLVISGYWKYPIQESSLTVLPIILMVSLVPDSSAFLKKTKTPSCQLSWVTASWSEGTSRGWPSDRLKSSLVPLLDIVVA